MTGTHSTLLASADEVARFQAENHFLMQTDSFRTTEEYCLHLMHQKAYEEISAITRGKLVLDVGCNNGYGSDYLARHGARVIGVDVSSTAIAEARRRFAADDLEFRVIDGRRLPFGSGTFDVVVSCQLIEHIRDYTGYLSELRRVLVPGGVAVFTTPNAKLRLDPGMAPWNQFHVREFTGAELHALLASSFEEVAVRGLFARDDIYEIEAGRVRRNRATARRIARRVKLRHAVVGTVKAAAPEFVVAWLRRMDRAGANAAEPNSNHQSDRRELDSTTRRRFATSDFFYRTDDLDRALDLMAICRPTTVPENS